MHGRGRAGCSQPGSSPGYSHRPASALPGGRCASSTWPSSFSSTTATTSSRGRDLAVAPSGAAVAAAAGDDAMHRVCCLLCAAAAKGADGGAVVQARHKEGSGEGRTRRTAAAVAAWAEAPAQCCCKLGHNQRLATAAPTQLEGRRLVSKVGGELTCPKRLAAGGAAWRLTLHCLAVRRTTLDVWRLWIVLNAR